MSFYFSLFQIIDSVERLSKDIQLLTSHALRIGPRDARANRELLENCQIKLAEVEKVLNNKTHISKITLRKAALLYQVVVISWRRVARLSAAAGVVEAQDSHGIWGLLGAAQKHYQVLVKALTEQTGVAPTINLEAEAATNLATVLKQEFADQGEILKHLDKAVEVFGEEQGLLETLMGIRKDLQDLRKRQKQYSTSVPSSPITVPASGPLPIAHSVVHAVPHAVNA
jgi:hypothetical protein